MTGNHNLSVCVVTMREEGNRVVARGGTRVKAGGSERGEVNMLESQGETENTRAHPSRKVPHQRPEEEAGGLW